MSDDWTEAVTVLLSVRMTIWGKVYSRILTDRAKRISELLVREEQDGFRKGKVYAVKMFSFKQVMENVPEEKKVLFIAFMNLEDA